MKTRIFLKRLGKTFLVFFVGEFLVAIISYLITGGSWYSVRDALYIAPTVGGFVWYPLCLFVKCNNLDFNTMYPFMVLGLLFVIFIIIWLLERNWKRNSS